MFEKLVKRTIFVAKCECGDEKILSEGPPPRERKCKCGKWVPYETKEWTGPDKFE
jgi:hypothetical protein